MTEEQETPNPDLDALLERLRSAQRELVMGAARAGMMPSDNALRKIADLESAILAVDNVIHEEGGERAEKAE